MTDGSVHCEPGTRRKRLIGGVMGLPPDGRHPGMEPPFLGPTSVLLATARSALVLLLRELRPPRLWLPSYLCSVLVTAAVHAESAIEFYDVGDRLLDSHGKALAGVGPGDCVLLIEYFGLPAHGDSLEQVRKRGAWAILDASQALLSRHDRAADFVLFSPHKWLGIPDGGILQPLGSKALAHPPLMPPPADWWEAACQARHRRRSFDLGGQDRSWFELFQRCDKGAPAEPFAMSGAARDLLASAFDYPEIERRRKRNYERLAAALDDVCLFPHLPADACPFGFPIRLRDRDAVRNSLFRKEIYAPLHWSFGDVVPEHFRASHRLSSEVMTLPCDQRYTEADMDWLAASVREASG